MEFTGVRKVQEGEGFTMRTQSFTVLGEVLGNKDGIDLVD